LATAALLFRWIFAKQKNEIIVTGSFGNIRRFLARRDSAKRAFGCGYQRQYKQRSGALKTLQKA
jgi:hypothetical protein